MGEGSVAQRLSLGRDDLCYSIVPKEADLEQGDILEDCPYANLVDIEKRDFGIERYRSIVLTQTCDIKQNKVDLVLVCPIWDVKDYIKDCYARYQKDENYRSQYEYINRNDVDRLGEESINKLGDEDLKRLYEKNFREELNNILNGARRAERNGYFMIKGCTIDGFTTDSLLVDFGNAYSLSLGYLIRFKEESVNNRYRRKLKQPFLRALLTAYGFSIMREALPDEYIIPKCRVPSRV